MSRMQVAYQKCQNADEAFSVVKEKLTPEVVGQFGVKADFDYDEEEREIQVTGKGFEFNMQFLDEGLELDLELTTFMLKPMRGTILSKIEKLLSHVL